MGDKNIEQFLKVSYWESLIGADETKGVLQYLTKPIENHSWERSLNELAISRLRPRLISSLADCTFIINVLFL